MNSGLKGKEIDKLYQNTLQVIKVSYLCETFFSLWQTYTLNIIHTCELGHVNTMYPIMASGALKDW